MNLGMPKERSRNVFTFNERFFYIEEYQIIHLFNLFNESKTPLKLQSYPHM